jgi:hypothetical protein
MKGDVGRGIVRYGGIIGGWRLTRESTYLVEAWAGSGGDVVMGALVDIVSVGREGMVDMFFIVGGEPGVGDVGFGGVMTKGPETAQ